MQKARGLERGGSVDEILRSVVRDETLFQETWEDELLDLKIKRASRLGMSGKHEEAAKSLEGEDLGGVKAHVEVATQYGFIAEANGIARQEKRDTLELMKKHLDLASLALSSTPSRSKAYWEFKIRDLEQKRRDLLSASEAVTRNSKPSAGAFERHFGSKQPNPKPDTVIVPKPRPNPRRDSSPSLRTSDRTPDNPIFNLRISSPQDIGEAEAKIVFQGMGLMNSRRSYQDALKGMKIGYTYSRKGPHRLDSKMKQWVFQEYVLMKKAMEKYAAYPEISQRKTPQLYEKWMQKASVHLTAISSPSERFRLLKSLMTQESGKVHWKKFKPTMGAAVDIGFGQFLPATAKSVGINPYDPGENIKGIAMYLNKLIRRKGMRNGLASYNGGNKPPAKSFAYADSIMNRMDSLV
ncbi:lytic transglycosylase domain-containing protein [bacterium]|nr:lytic transglycosylase domain-containing protein [bacterium]